MANIKITCDSASDLPRELAARYRIDVLPLPIEMDGHVRRDRVDVDSRDAYAYTRKTGRLPRICPVSTEDYRRAFARYTGEGREVIHVSLSGALSQCFRNAREAAKDFGNVHVVDSRSASTGAGQLALLAAELASAEYLAEEIVEALNEMKEKLEVSFLVQAPEYLRRGCRPGGLAAVGDKLLKLKPEVELHSGVFHRVQPIRGDMETSILDYVRRCLSGRKNIQTDRAFITYADVPRAIVDKVIGLMHELQPFEEILEAPAASVVSGRCGPGCLGLSYLTC